MGKESILLCWMIALSFSFIKIIVGMYLWFMTPKRNYIIGFKTKDSLNSNEIWKYSNKLLGKLALILGIIEIVAVSVTLPFILPKYIIIYGIILVVLTFDIYIIIVYANKKIKRGNMNG